MKESKDRTKEARGYAPVNGLKMYYEIEGTGDPLVCIPPAFGYAGVNPYPALAQNHTVITIDLQGHGRTADIPDRPLSIEQYAKDVVGLLKYLGISQADFFGESYGGNTAALIAIRYAQACPPCGDLRSHLWPSSDCIKPSHNAF
jgi:pimeloyl-ACP methyl ester carboxylesterase